MVFRSIILVMIIVAFVFIWQFLDGAEVWAATLHTNSTDRENREHTRKKILSRSREDARVYRENGFRIVGRKQRWRLKITGKMIADAGNFDTHEHAGSAYPDLAGSKSDLRRFTIIATGNIGSRVSFKGEVDFAHSQDIMDDWIRIKKIPLLDCLTLGHQMEPFSLDNLTPIHSKTFMEQSLASDALSPGRNIGILANKPLFDDRMTWAIGGYLHTGSIKNAGDAKNQIDKKIGYNITGRITGLPWYAGSSDKMLHLGLAFSHQILNDDENDPNIRFRARPETRLTDTRLVDTGKIIAQNNDIVNAELVLLLNNFSLQGELYHNFLDAVDLKDPEFWGFYLYGSFFITGEHRTYLPSQAVFTRVVPHQPFSLKKRMWGAWELALRYSYIDLNDSAINGGMESNWSLGLNWYLTPYIRLMLNAIHGRVKDRETAPAMESGSVGIFQARFQIAL